MATKRNFKQALRLPTYLQFHIHICQLELLRFKAINSFSVLIFFISTHSIIPHSFDVRNLSTFFHIKFKHFCSCARFNSKVLFSGGANSFENIWLQRQFLFKTIQICIYVHLPINMCFIHRCDKLTSIRETSLYGWYQVWLTWTLPNRKVCSKATKSKPVNLETSHKMLLRQTVSFVSCSIQNSSLIDIVLFMVKYHRKKLNKNQSMWRSLLNVSEFSLKNIKRCFVQFEPLSETCFHECQLRVIYTSSIWTVFCSPMRILVDKTRPLQNNKFISKIWSLRIEFNAILKVELYDCVDYRKVK